MWQWLASYFNADVWFMSLIRVLGACALFAIVFVALGGGGWPWDPAPHTNPAFWDGLPWLFPAWAVAEIGYAIYRWYRSA